MMLKGADKAGKLDSFVKLNITGAAQGDGNAQQAFREVLSDMNDAELLEANDKVLQETPSPIYVG